MAAMRSPLRLAGIGIAVMGLVLIAGTAHAVEYRLFVASVYDTSFTSFVSVGELNYGASGPGLQSLETAISNGEIGNQGRHRPRRRRRRTLGRGALGRQAGRAQHLADQGHGQLQAAGRPAHDPRERRDPRAPVSAVRLHWPVAA